MKVVQTFKYLDFDNSEDTLVCLVLSKSNGLQHV